eukprot:7631446-Pyramimonas_sp.AAC.1
MQPASPPASASARQKTQKPQSEPSGLTRLRASQDKGPKGSMVLSLDRLAPSSRAWKDEGAPSSPELTEVSPLNSSRNSNPSFPRLGLQFPL